MTAMHEYRPKLLYAGGLLTGVGLSGCAFGLWIVTLMHRMFIANISTPRLFLAVAISPAVMVAFGVWMAWSGRLKPSLQDQ